MNDPSDVQDQITADIRAQLARQRMSFTELGRRLNRPASWVGRHLNGVTPLTVPDLELIADVLGVQLTIHLGPVAMPGPPLFTTGVVPTNEERVTL